MNTVTVRVDPASPDPGVIARAAAVIRAGRLVAFPTETVYGLGANALDPQAVRKVYEAKGRPGANPLIVHVTDAMHVLNVVKEWPATADRLARRFWPGPLTLVVPRGPEIPDEVTAHGPTVAVRCPAHTLAQALIRAAGAPIAAPSANRSTELSPTRAEHVLAGLEGRIDMILDGGPCPGGIESTVVDASGDGVRLLRPGPITVPMLEEVIGPVAIAGTVEGPARSPGQMAKHYSPRTPLRLLLPGVAAADWLGQSGDASRLAILTFKGGTACDADLSADPVVAAAHLYDALHELDRRSLDVILVEMPPNTPAWAAIRDRLTRAAESSSR